MAAAAAAAAEAEEAAAAAAGANRNNPLAQVVEGAGMLPPGEGFSFNTKFVGGTGETLDIAALIQVGMKSVVFSTKFINLGMF